MQYVATFDEFLSAKKIITCRSKHWMNKFPKGCGLEFIDLVQEGWLVYTKALYSYNYKAKFTTFLQMKIDSRFLDLLRGEWSRAKNIVRYEPKEKEESTNVRTEEEICSGEKDDSERLLMLKEALVAMSEVSSDFVQMIINECPRSLLVSAKRRIRLGKKKEFDAKIRITKKMIQDEYAIDIKELQNIFGCFL